MRKRETLVRQANATDVEMIAGFNRALCLETENHELDMDTVLAGVRRFVTDEKHGRYFVAELDGRVVGQAAHTYEWSDWRNGQIWWIQSVYVHPDQRGNGVFRSLCSHIRRLGEQDPDCCGIRLYMERDNHIARQTYSRLGFAETGYEVLELLLPKSGQS